MDALVLQQMNELAQRAVIRTIGQRSLVWRRLSLTNPASELFGNRRRNRRKRSRHHSLAAYKAGGTALPRSERAREAILADRQTRNIFQWGVTEMASGGEQRREQAFDERKQGPRHPATLRQVLPLGPDFLTTPEDEPPRGSSSITPNTSPFAMRSRCAADGVNANLPRLL